LACGVKKPVIRFFGKVPDPLLKAETRMKVTKSIARGKRLADLNILWLLFLLTAGPAISLWADGGRMPVEWETHQWLKESGLPDNSVSCLLQTRDRFLWVGTGAGLARFDGNQFEMAGDASGRVLKITCLYEDSSARL
jgi:hypothetical protein